MNEKMYSAMAQSIIDGEAEEAEKLALQSVELGIDPLDAINHGFVVGVDHVGNLFSSGDAFLPELVMAGEAMKAAINSLEPEMSKQGKGREILGTIVLGTIEGDIHDIGKSLVGTMLSVAGFKVFDGQVELQEVQVLVHHAYDPLHRGHGIGPLQLERNLGAGGEVAHVVGEAAQEIGLLLEQPQALAPLVALDLNEGQIGVEDLQMPPHLVHHLRGEPAQHGELLLSQKRLLGPLQRLTTQSFHRHLCLILSPVELLIVCPGRPIVNPFRRKPSAN